jgi:hypothetical protein
MRNTFFLIALVSGISIIAGCNGDKIQNQWADEKITVDGKFADWEGIPQNIIEDQNIVIGTANDENNFYLMLRMNDERMARRIRMMGVTVWLNKDGKKKKDYGICYTGSTDLHISNRPGLRPDDEQSTQMEERMEKMREKLGKNLPRAGRIMIIQGDEKTERDESSFDGPAAGSTYQNGVFCYEFKLPIPINTELNKKLKLGIELGGMSEEYRNAMRQEMGGRRGSGMGGRPRGFGGRSGGMGGRPGGTRGGERPSGGVAFEKQDIWFDVLLAKKP